jgi:uncharacterized protein YkwD
MDMSLVMKDYSPLMSARAHSTRARFAVAVLLMAALVLVSIQPASAAIDPSRRPMRRETNQSRVGNGVPRVDLHRRLSDLARRHSIRMARRGVLFHTPDPASYYLRGVRWSTWGENVGYTTGTVGRLQRLFMRSPSHRSNILNGRFQHTAIGTVRRDGVLWVTVFFYG